MHARFHLPAGMQVFERGWLSSNNILFCGADAALVDSGYHSHAAQTLALVRHALKGGRLERLYNTHLHSDHCGGNAALQQAFGCRTIVPAAELEHVRRWDEQALSFQATGQRCGRFGCDGAWQAGDAVKLGGMDWQVLGAPGHDPHSVILYCPDEKILISADALWENGFGVVFPELEGETGFAEARATLEVIASLELRLVIPGHGPMFAEAGRALDTAFSRIEYLAADPVRNARNAVKVLLKFLLLERQGMPLASIGAILDGIPLCRQANRRYLHLDREALAEWAVDQLVRAGAARIASGALHNSG